MTFSSIGSAGTPWRVQLWWVHHLVCLALGVPRQAGTCAWTNLGCVVVDEESDIQTGGKHTGELAQQVHGGHGLDEGVAVRPRHLQVLDAQDHHQPLPARWSCDCTIHNYHRQNLFGTKGNTRKYIYFLSCPHITADGGGQKWSTALFAFFLLLLPPASIHDSTMVRFSPSIYGFGC